MTPERTPTEDGDQLSGRVEEATGRLREAMAILHAIDSGGLLRALPAAPSARQSHQAAVSMLAVLRRELQAVGRELDAAVQTRSLIQRATRAAAGSRNRT